MSVIRLIKKLLFELLKQEYQLSEKQALSIQIELNTSDSKDFGDVTCNAALVLAKELKLNPRAVAQQIKEKIEAEQKLSQYIASIDIAGPGFINIFFHENTWQTIAHELFTHHNELFQPEQSEQAKPRKKYLLEFVSANPTGPLHLGHGRGGIIGDVLANVLGFLGHEAHREFYINDAGAQIEKLGRSFKARCYQELEQPIEFPDDGYAGEYLIELAKECLEKHGNSLLEKEDYFFQEYAKEQLLEQIKQTLDRYGIQFDRWFSERQLHKSGAVEQVIQLLRDKGLVYKKDDATWFQSTKFGDDKDRVVKKSDGTLTYIAADIAYHKDKFDRGYDKLIDILGQDHHGYVTRLKATLESVIEKKDCLDVILYQLVSIKSCGEQVKMSKRAGTFEKLEDVIEKVGTDVARFFYLNRKANAHLDFDLDTALKKTEENPAYYIQYSYVRTNSLFEKAGKIDALRLFVEALQTGDTKKERIKEAASHVDQAAIALIKKISSLETVLSTVASTYQTHLLSYYTLELARMFHAYYAGNKIINPDDIETSKSRLLLTKLVQQTLDLCLDLLGLSKPKRM
ncbi:arginine--tRNA ligase [Candidatus Dependentiae bacterium]|nr:arginine--tRNA ligase [Candidatus Dependentiae bacterium]